MQTSMKDDEGGGALGAYYDKLFASPATAGTMGAPGSGMLILKGARADDGTTCALEYTVVQVHGKDVVPQAGLAVYERGDSGLLRSVRIYQDVDV